MKKNIFLSILLMSATFATDVEPFFSSKQTAIEALDEVYYKVTSGQRTWYDLPAIEIIEDLRMWGEHSCPDLLKNDTNPIAVKCFQLIEFYLTGGFGFDTHTTQTSSDNLSILKAIASAIYYQKQSSVQFFHSKQYTSPDPAIKQELKHINAMVTVAKAFHEGVIPTHFSTRQSQWLQFLRIDHWMLHSEFSEQKSISLESLPPQSYIAYLGSPNKGIDRLQPDNNGFGWLSNFYVSGGNNPNSSIHEQKGIPLSVRYGDQHFESCNLETLHHMHKMVLTSKLSSLEDAISFSKLSPGEALKTCREVVKRRDYDVTVSDKHMWLLLQQKYYNNPVLGKSLLNLGHLLIFEGNNWNDSLWGMHFIMPFQFSGGNKIGKMLVRTQELLRYEYSVNMNFRAFINGTNPLYQHISTPVYSEVSWG